jgi:hypothetical protein
MGKLQIWDPGSGINILDHISESFVLIFWVKNTFIFVAEPDPVLF